MTVPAFSENTVIHRRKLLLCSMPGLDNGRISLIRMTHSRTSTSKIGQPVQMLDSAVMRLGGSATTQSRKDRRHRQACRLTQDN